MTRPTLAPPPSQTAAASLSAGQRLGGFNGAAAAGDPLRGDAGGGCAKVSGGHGRRPRESPRSRPRTALRRRTLPRRGRDGDAALPALASTTGAGRPALRSATARAGPAWWRTRPGRRRVASSRASGRTRWHTAFADARKAQHSTEISPNCTQAAFGERLNQPSPRSELDQCPPEARDCGEADRSGAPWPSGCGVALSDDWQQRRSPACGE